METEIYTLNASLLHSGKRDGGQARPNNTHCIEEDQALVGGYCRSQREKLNPAVLRLEWKQSYEEGDRSSVRLAAVVTLGMRAASQPGEMKSYSACSFALIAV